MSYQGQTWVDSVALPDLKNTGELAIMLRVANHAGNGPKKMSGCTASAETLARECVMGRSTALNHLRNLRKRGLLVPGDPALVAHLPADKRPPVYDLAGAHEPGCVGGHTYLAECSTTGAQIKHPLKKPRSAGAQIKHPQSGKGGAGAQIDVERVLKSSTKSSKELKESSLSPGASPSSSAPDASAGLKDEREAAEPKNNNPADSPAGIGDTGDVDKVVDAYIGAYMTAVNLPPQPDAIKSVRAAAAALLSAGRSVGKLCTLAAELPGKGWTDLVRHALHNPEATARPAAHSKPWCGECNYGQEPTFPAGRLREGADDRMEKCHCHPGYVPPQPSHA